MIPKNAINIKFWTEHIQLVSICQAQKNAPLFFDSRGALLSKPLAGQLITIEIVNSHGSFNLG